MEYLKRNNMAVPQHKAELQAAIQTNYNKLQNELLSITSENAERKELEGHAKETFISVNNVLAYLIGWGQLVLKWVNKKTQGLSVDFPETGYQWNQLGKLAQKFYTDYQHEDFITLQQLLDQTVADLQAMIAEKSNEELYDREWYGKWTLGRMIQFNTSSPYTNARGRIRKWKKLIDGN